MNTSPVPVVEVLSAEKVFGNGTRALDPISLTVQPGEFITLLGPSGCGKSTLLKMIANLIEPSEGRINWWRGGHEAVGKPGRKLVFVFQDATLMPWARVAGNVRLPLDLAGVDRGEADRRVAASLDLVGLSQFGRHYPRQLSGGMQMRASDEITRNRLDADLLRLWQEKNLTIIFVTHSIYEAVFLSTRVIVMAARPGRILREVTIDEPHPRGEAFRVSQAFAGYARELQHLLVEASHGAGPQPGDVVAGEPA